MSWNSTLCSWSALLFSDNFCPFWSPFPLSQNTVICNKKNSVTKSLELLYDCGSANVSSICPAAEEIENDSWVEVKLPLLFHCHPLLGWSAAGAVVRWLLGHTVVLFWEKGCFTARWQLLAETVMALCFLRALRPFFSCFLCCDPQLQPNGRHPSFNPATSKAGTSYRHMCAHPSSGCVRRPNQTG